MKTYKLTGAIGLVALMFFAGLTIYAQRGGPIMEERRMQRHMDREAMMERCEQMHERMEQMHERMEQMDQELQQRVQAIEEAEGDAKVEAMEEAIRTLADQRQQMHERRQQMMQNMMQHMGEHMMMAGGEDDMHRMMMRCPMMQSRQEADAEAASVEPVQ